MDPIVAIDVVKPELPSEQAANDVPEGNESCNDSDDDVVFTFMKESRAFKGKTRPTTAEEQGKKRRETKKKTTRSGRTVRAVNRFCPDNLRRRANVDKERSSTESTSSAAFSATSSQTPHEATRLNAEHEAAREERVSGDHDNDEDIVVRVRGVHRSFKRASSQEIKKTIHVLRRGHEELLKQAKVVELSAQRLEAMLVTSQDE